MSGWKAVSGTRRVGTFYPRWVVQLASKDTCLRTQISIMCVGTIQLKGHKKLKNDLKSQTEYKSLVMLNQNKNR